MKNIIAKLQIGGNIPLIIMVSLIAWGISYANNTVMTYNDAMSHINISRLVIDNREPGFSQLGGVWLPLTHIFPLLFIWNDWAWHSGFAGSIFSMASYVLAVWSIYQTLLIITKKNIASLIGSFVLAFNLNMLYLQTTPMTEPMYIGFFALSILIFIKYLLAENNIKYLLFLGFIGFLQVLTRYDGWFVVIMVAFLIAANEFYIIKKSVGEMLGKIMLYATPVAFGIGLWLVWNFLIFGDPFYFAFGPYSAHAQQESIAASGALDTKGNIFISSLTYMDALLFNNGLFIVINAIAGGFVFFLNKKVSMAWNIKLLFILFLTSPIIFNIVALFLGFSTIFTPHYNVDQTLEKDAVLFNIRYGLLALPMIAILIGIFASWRKMAALIAFELIFLQGIYMYNSGIVTLIDGKSGISSYAASDITQAVKENVKPKDTILMTMYTFKPVAFKSGIQLNQIIHEGVSKEWDKALANPELYADWIVMENASNDQVYDALVNKQKSTFLNSFTLVYTGNNSSLYKRK